MVNVRGQLGDRYICICSWSLTLRALPCGAASTDPKPICVRPHPQRGIYPPESFARVGKYGLQMLVTSDAGLQKYLQQVLTQLSEWLYAGSVQKLVLVITSLETQTVCAGTGG
jgi:hypothetical protein